MAFDIKTAEHVLLILDHMILDLNGRKVKIPHSIIITMRCIKSLINYYKNNFKNSNNYQLNSRIQENVLFRIRNELINVENFLVIKAANEVGVAYSEEWSSKLMRAWSSFYPTESKELSNSIITLKK